MTKRLLIVLLVLAGLAAGAVSAIAATAPRASLRPRSLVCRHGRDPRAREVGITAVMQPLPGTRQMAMRFELQGQSPGGSYTTIRGGDLNMWIPPRDPTLGQRPGDTWIVPKQVWGVAAPAHYRFQVFFRWKGAHNRVLGTVVLQSGRCWQPELRPDLSVDNILVIPDRTNPKRDNYVAIIHNRGATDAGAFQVQFAPGGTANPVVDAVPGLRAHSAVRVPFFRQPLCQSASPPTVTVYPNRMIDDYNRANNTLTAVCPAP